DPKGNSTQYQYDDLGNLLQLNSPDTGITNYTAYDAAGNLLSQTDANGQATSYQYDALNRLTQITYNDGTTTVYSYDVGTNAQGRLNSITTPSDSISYSYDPHGRLTSKTQTIGQGPNSQSLTTGYQYNAQGQLTQTTYPSGKVIGYSYSNGQLSQLTVDGQPMLSHLSHDPFGPITGWSWGSNTTADISRSYDLDGQLSDYTQANSISKQLSYSNTGNITAIQEPGNAANDTTYGYDKLHRLTDYTGTNSTQLLAYDANGNRLAQIINDKGYGYSSDGDSNQLQSSMGPTQKIYQDNANGNITHDGRYSYNYDARNRLINVDNSYHYAHNGLGQRIQKTVPATDHSNTSAGDANGDGLITQQDHDIIVQVILGNQTTTHDTDCNQDSNTNVQDLVCINNKINNAPNQNAITLFAYDETGQLIGEYKADGTPIQETIYLGSMPVVVLKDNNTYRVYADHLNTPRAITDTNNGVVWEWRNDDPFGANLANSDPDGDGTDFIYNLRFPGQYFDEETGLHYNATRDYDPQTGRYIQSDSIGLAGGLNTYAYANNNPLTYVDPEGKSALIWTIPIVVGGGFTILKFKKFNDCVEACESTNAQCEDGNTRPNLNCRNDCFWQIMGKKKNIKPPVRPSED
ncbi:RHS repeat-associated core domain-containing protein, partial [Pseudomonadota bacterium]